MLDYRVSLNSSRRQCIISQVREYNQSNYDMIACGRIISDTESRPATTIAGSSHGTRDQHDILIILLYQLQLSTAAPNDRNCKKINPTHTNYRVSYRYLESHVVILID